MTQMFQYHLRKERNIERGQCCLRFQHIRPQKRSPEVMYLTDAQERGGLVRQRALQNESSCRGEKSLRAPLLKANVVRQVHFTHEIQFWKQHLCSKWPIFTKTQPKMHVNHTIWLIFQLLFFFMIVVKKHRQTDRIRMHYRKAWLWVLTKESQTDFYNLSTPTENQWCCLSVQVSVEHE